MESQAKEIGRFGSGISLVQDLNGKLRPIFGTTSIKYEPRAPYHATSYVCQILENNYYPDFAGKMTTISGDAED